MNDQYQQNIIEFLKHDQRNCRSRNIQKFFSDKKTHQYLSVIMFDGVFWFASLGWDPDGKGFAGVRVMEVACQGWWAKTCYPSWQRPENWTDVTALFWEKYKEAGILSFPDIWHIKIPPVLTHQEAHMI